MKGERIVIPTSCRDLILADLHKSHEGANRSLSLARTCVYWPGMEADMMDYIKRCVTCIDNAKMPVETLHPHEVPAGPWIKVGMDFFQDDSGQKFLIVADYFSKFPFIFPVASTHHHKTLTHLRDLFLTEGVPAVVMTDNGPPSTVKNSSGLRENLTSSTRRPHRTCINWMDSSRPWWRRWKPPTRKRTDLQMLKREHYCGYVTPRSQKIYHHQQKFYTDGPHKELSYPDITDLSTSQESADDF